jgi:hypothetical protein
MRTPRAMTSPQSSQVLSRSQGRAPTASGGAAGGSNISSMRLHRREDFLPFGHRGCGSQARLGRERFPRRLGDVQTLPFQ